MKKKIHVGLDRLIASTLLVDCLYGKDDTAQPSSALVEFSLFAFCSQRSYKIKIWSDDRVEILLHYSNYASDELA